MISFAPLAPDAKELLSEETGIDFTKAEMGSWFCVTARYEEGGIMGVLACEPMNDFDWRFSIALPDPACLSPKLLKVVFTTLFKKAARITATIDPDNKRAIDQAEKFGFTYEGFLRRGLDGQRDAALYGMLPEECIWLIDPKHHRALRQGVRHGQPTQAS